MTIKEILEEIYRNEDILASCCNHETDIFVAALCCAAKIIAKHNLLKENISNGIDVESLNDFDLKLYHSWLHNAHEFAEIELEKRGIPAEISLYNLIRNNHETFKSLHRNA